MASSTTDATHSGDLLYATIASPIGGLLLLGEEGVLRGLYMQEGRKPMHIESAWRRAAEPFGNVISQLQEYFAGARSVFDVALHLEGTPFERRVWRALQDIPYGATVTYGEVARRIGEPAAARAVGLANGRNPVAVIVPCHRVIGANGTLIGYGGGIERKRALLDLERGQPSLAL